MFRYKTGIRVSYLRQGYIYFASRLYQELNATDKRKIEKLCYDCAGPSVGRALLEFVTTDADATWICREHNLSKSTLYRAVRRYYERFPRKL